MSEPEKALSDFVATLTYDAVPEVARETVRRAFLDIVGVTLASAFADAARDGVRGQRNRRRDRGRRDHLGCRD